MSKCYHTWTLGSWGVSNGEKLPTIFTVVCSDCGLVVTALATEIEGLPISKATP